MLEAAVVLVGPVSKLSVSNVQLELSTEPGTKCSTGEIGGMGQNGILCCMGKMSAEV
jgi:hypothetical protein